VAVTELAPPPGLAELRERYRAFMDEHVYPAEPDLDREDDAAERLNSYLRRAGTRGEGRV